MINTIATPCIGLPFHLLPLYLSLNLHLEIKLTIIHQGTPRKESCVIHLWLPRQPMPR